MRFRPLMPLLVAWDRREFAEQAYLGPRWAWYQALRFLILWIALWIDATGFGVTHAAVVAGLVGLTLRFDYWSNAIELLASTVLATGALGAHWGWGVLLGLVLGLGRETIPLLGLAGGIPLALGAAASQGALRFCTKQDPFWGDRAKTMEYGWSQARHNLNLLLMPPNWDARVLSWIYLAVGLLAGLKAPLLAASVIGVTFWKCRIDEPRVLTMLTPWAACTLLKL